MADSTSNHVDSNTLEPLRVQTQLKSRYIVFDASGRLPFGVVLGLGRRSDSDTRDKSFQTTNASLHVPYALASRLLSLHELRTSATSPKERVEVDLSCLRDAIADDEPALKYITLPSKMNRTKMRGQMCVTEFRYRVEPGSPLASIFESGKKYSIGVANRSLGTHRWIETDRVPSSSTSSYPTVSIESAVEHCELVSNPHRGFAVFTVVESLIWPPTIENRMRLLSPKVCGDPSSDHIDRPFLRVTVTNTGSEPYRKVAGGTLKTSRANLTMMARYQSAV